MAGAQTRLRTIGVLTALAFIVALSSFALRVFWWTHQHFADCYRQGWNKPQPGYCGRFFAGMDDLVWAFGIAGDSGPRSTVEASAMAFVAVHAGGRVLGERANAYANGVRDARGICLEKYALMPVHAPYTSFLKVELATNR